MHSSTAAWMIGKHDPDPEAGQRLLSRIALRVDEARRKHPVFAEGKYHALGVIGAEYAELVQAVESETDERAQDEALDVIATCIRFLLAEHEAGA